MTWVKGQPWRVVRSLERLNAQIRAAYPRAAPPATPAVSWGSIADSAHSTTSDHYPHYYSALGSTAVVCARDFPHAPALGLDAHALAENLRVSRDPRIGYIISNGRITGPNYGWRWATYSGRDPHDTHIHVSSVRTAVADDPRDWPIGEDVDMTPEQDARLKRVEDKLSRLDGREPIGQVYLRLAVGKDHAEGATPVTHPTLTSLAGQLAALRTDLAALAGRDLVDESAVAAELAPAILAQLRPEDIAEAIPPTVAKQVADELAARLADRMQE